MKESNNNSSFISHNGLEKVEGVSGADVTDDDHLFWPFEEETQEEFEFRMLAAHRGYEV